MDNVAEEAATLAEELCPDRAGEAIRVAEEAWYELPVNRSAPATAAGAVYLVSGEGVTQQAVASESGLNIATVRESAKDIRSSGGGLLRQRARR